MAGHIEKRNSTVETVAIMIIAFFHLCFTLFTDPIIFTASRKEHIIAYGVLKVLLYIVLVLFWKWMFLLMSKEENAIKKITLYSIPYLLVLLVCIVLRNKTYLSSDELRIFNCVIDYNLFPHHFTYFTGLVYAIPLMLVPHQLGMLLVHIIIQSLVCGYVLYRSRNYFKTIFAFLVLAVFLLAPTLEQGMRIHRMQWYGLLYLFIIVKLIFDYMENKDYKKSHLALLSVGFSILAIWRKEGIYLLVFAPLIIMSVYHIRSKKKIISIFEVFFLIFGLIYLPQQFDKQAVSDEECDPWVSWFVNMSRIGINRDKYSKEMQAIDKYSPLSSVDFVNKELGNENYGDVCIRFKQGYIGINFDATQEERREYKKAVTKIVFSEPFTFLKTRKELWLYTSLSEGWVSAYNLNIPLLALIICLIYSAVRKKWAYFWISSGLLLNMLMTLIFAPASYFKYYYHAYLVGWLFITIAATYVCENIKIKK